MSSLIYIPETTVKALLNFEAVYEAIKIALKSVAEKRVIQNARAVMPLATTPANALFAMPGYLQDETYGSLGCKLVTTFPNNPDHGLPSTLANILLMDEETGFLKAVIAGTEITKWRTAAASAIATSYLHGNKSKNILAIIGAGEQGKIHAEAFQHYFSFKEVRIWNYIPEIGRTVVKELNKTSDVFVAYDDIEECVKNADVIVTATFSPRPLVKYEWLKRGVHINAIGGDGINFELDKATYAASHVYIDSWEGAKNELAILQTEFKGQIGDLVTGSITAPGPDTTTVFQSLGMAVEDCAVARLVYDLYMQDNNH